METKRLERIILLILLLLNLFLLILVLKDDAERRQADRATESLLAALLEENGITPGQELTLLQTAPHSCTVVRELGDEERRIEKIIGEHSVEDAGGSIRYYLSERAQASLRGTGEFDMLISGIGLERTEQPERVSAEIFEKAGVRLWLDGWKPGRDPDRVTLCCCWNGLPVFNAKLNFDYSPERLEMISGTLVFSKQTAEGTETPMDSATVLTRFVSLIKQEGLICSRIERLTPGYLMAVTLSGESVLTPVWYIATDTADFYINAMTGQEEKVEGA